MHPQHTGDAGLRGVSEAPEDHTATQRDVDRLEKCADKNVLKFNQGTWRVLPLGRNSPRYQDRLGLPGW